MVWMSVVEWPCGARDRRATFEWGRAGGAGGARPRVDTTPRPDDRFHTVVAIESVACPRTRRSPWRRCLGDVINACRDAPSSFATSSRRRMAANVVEPCRRPLTICDGPVRPGRFAGRRCVAACRRALRSFAGLRPNPAAPPSPPADTESRTSSARRSARSCQRGRRAGTLRPRRRRRCRAPAGPAASAAPRRW